MYSGLGIVNAFVTGVTPGGATATCVYDYERAEARTKCASGQIRGLGATEMMSGRLAGLDPCSVVNLPTCPTPTCLGESTALLIASCSSGAPLAPDVANWCNSNGWWPYFNLPYCSRPSFLPAPPACLSPDQLRLAQYCNAHGFQGPDQGMNTYCWLATKDASWWRQFSAVPACAAAPPPPAPAPPPPTPVYVPPPLPPAPPPGPEPLPPLPLPPTPHAPHASSATFGVMGILFALAVAGGSYYAYRKYRTA